MKKLPMTLLGVPVTSLSTEEIAQEILKEIEAPREDPEPLFVDAVNIDLLMESLAWNPGDTRFPELLHILRGANLSTVECRPLIWLSKALGNPLKERIVGVDLLSKIAELLGTNKKSVYLLGGQEKALKLCSLYLQALYPNLIIAGCSYPDIYTEGQELNHALEKDAILVDLINRARPDLLFVNLGNPKQELWFQRVKFKLRVRVVVSVGDAFEMLTGMRPTAPRWMQKSGLEWVHRLFHHPRSRWKRYLYDTVKFCYISLPLLIYHTISRLLLHRGKNDRFTLPQLFLSAHHSIAMLPLPPSLNQQVSQQVAQYADDLLSQDILLLDFSHVRHIDLEGMGLLNYLWREAYRKRKPIYGIGLSSDIALLMRLHRVWDIFANSFSTNLQELVTRISRMEKGASFYDSIQQDSQNVMISFLGRLDHFLNFDQYLKKIEPIIHQKQCILNLTYCTYIDNRGIEFLLKLAKQRLHFLSSLKLYGVSPTIKRQLRIAKVDHLFDFM